MISQNKITGFLVNAAPYIFLVGLFFCFLDKILFGEESIWLPLLFVVLLMGGVLLILYLAPPRAAYNSNVNEFSLPYKYILTENGFSVGREVYDENKYIPYSSLFAVYDAEDSFYFAGSENSYIILKNGISRSGITLIQSFLQAKIGAKYVKIKD